MEMVRTELATNAFAGKDTEGKEYGVYVDWEGDKMKPLWKMEIRGGFRTFVRSMELSDDELIEAFGLDSDY
jgi:hypothetical protein